MMMRHQEDRLAMAGNDYGPTLGLDGFPPKCQNGTALRHAYPAARPEVERVHCAFLFNKSLLFSKEIRLDINHF